MYWLNTALQDQSLSYKIGYYAGAWLPFIIIAVLAIAIINKQKRR